MDLQEQETLDIAWEQRLELWAKGSELCTEADRLHTEADRLLIESLKRYKESNRIYEESYVVWTNAIIEVGGDIQLLQWIYRPEKNTSACKLETGEVFEP